MHIKSLLFIASIIFTSCSSIKKYNEQISKLHSPQELREDVDAAYNQLKKYHPRLYQYTPKEQMDFKFDSLKNAIKTPLSSRDFYEKLAPVVGSVRQGHVSISPPNIKRSRKERKNYKDKAFAFNTMDFEYLENTLWLTNAKGKESLLIGSEVAAVEDKTPKELIEKYNTLIASDGFNKTLFDGIVGSRFTRYYLKNNGFQDSIHVTFKNTDSIFTRTILWKKKKDAKENSKDSIANDSIDKLVVKKLTKEERKAERTAERLKRKYNSKRGYIESKNEYTRTFDLIGADSLVAYMKIRGFSNGNPEDFYAESFKTIDSLGVKTMILDLRNNGGGSLDEIDNLYSYFTETPYTLVEPSEVTTRIPFLPSFVNNTSPVFLKGLAIVFAPVIITHNLLKTKKIDGTIYYRLKSSKEHKPNPQNYKGKLYVLINGNSFSASSILSTQLKATNKATFVGQETGGAYNGTVAGIMKGYELPNSKIVMRLGLMQIETFYNVEPDGFGVTVDKEIIPTRADREAKRDPEIDWILNDIKSNE
ncbi:periplasmic protease [Aequorivita sublithincola DSM 14238]|uniref:Periplasmic protease n=1 Tax=Aequorivita sublithincola (strain DSM 14238 / LMG 21431 / ACAM 643 / 9-3) TaxID=746697 RepID=I3YZS4_AEQSU|nr:S41 family peptidase [Aequorivita sublithincola]AFL82492.1 periplasmic protease [Aequorivita sublithincola DSM 14238]